MAKTFRRLVPVLCLQLSAAFVVGPRLRLHPTKICSSRLFLAAKDDYPGPSSSSSRITGNQRPPTPQELEVMDEMIDKLADAKPYDLPTAVQRAFRVISSPQFFLRIANRVDQADAQDREKLQALASNLVSTLEAVVSTTTDRLEERSQQVQKVVAAAAEPETGEFLVPLTSERRAAMRQALAKMDPADLDQGFVSTIDTWMNKSHKDGLDGMVTILQQTLQMYAGLVIRRTRQEQGKADATHVDAATIVDELLETDAEQWDTVLLAQKDQLEAVVSEIQRAMETIVLSLEAGSAIQQVQAEYLQEMAKRAEAVQKKS